MSVYMIIDLKVTDPETYVEYVEKVPETVKEYGGRYLARGGKVTTLSGDWYPERIIVIEFPTFDHLKDWAMSREQIPLSEIRRKSTESRAIVVEGCAPDGSEPVA